MREAHRKCMSRRSNRAKSGVNNKTPANNRDPAKQPTCQFFDELAFLREVETNWGRDNTNVSSLEDGDGLAIADCDDSKLQSFNLNERVSMVMMNDNDSNDISSRASSPNDKHVDMVYVHPRVTSPASTQVQTSSNNEVCESTPTPNEVCEATPTPAPIAQACLIGRPLNILPTENTVPASTICVRPITVASNGLTIATSNTAIRPQYILPKPSSSLTRAKRTRIEPTTYYVANPIVNTNCPRTGALVNTETASEAKRKRIDGATTPSLDTLLSRVVDKAKSNENALHRGSTNNTSNSSDNRSNVDCNEHVNVSNTNGHVLSGNFGTDDNTLFCMSLVPSLRRLDDRKNAMARLKIQELLYNIEFD